MNTQKLLFSVLTSLLLFLILEGMAQMVTSDWDTEVQTGFGGATVMPFHPTRLWGFKPTTEYTLDGVQYKITEDGLRQSPLTEGISTETVLAIGDSSTYGFGVQSTDTYLNLVGNCLNAQTLNGAVPGYSSAQSLVLLEELLETHTFSKLIIANLWSDMMPAQESDAKRLSRVQEWNTFRLRTQGVLYQHSATYRWLLGTVKPPTPEEVPIDSILMAEERGRLRRVSPVEYGSNLSRMVELAVQHNVEPIILLLPTNFSQDHPPKTVQAPYRNGAKEVSDEHHLVFIDMDSVQSSHPNAERFLDFVHPSAVGHQEIGNILCQKLQ